METMISALKRNDRIAITAEILEILGHSERAKEARQATRATVAFFDRSFKDLPEPSFEESAQVSPAEEVADLIFKEEYVEAKKVLKTLDKEDINYKIFKKAIKKGMK